jgi:hypothetical protein
LNIRLLILAALVAAVWACVFFWPQAVHEGPEAVAWPPYDLMLTTRVQQKTENATLTLERDSGAWFLSNQEQTVRFRADRSRVEALFNFVRVNKPLRSLGSVAESKVSDFGLDNPRSVLTLESDTTWQVRIGARNPSGDGVYAQSSSEPGEVLLLDAGFEKQTTHQETYFQDLRLMDMDPEYVERVRVEGQATWELSRKEQAMVFSWPQELTTHTVAQPEANMYLHELTSAKGLEYAPRWSPEGRAPDLTVSVWRKAAETPEVLHLYKIDPLQQEPPTDTPEGGEFDLMAVSSWQTAPLSLEPQTWGKLARSAFSLRKRGVVDLDAGSLRRMELNPIQGRGYLTLEAHKQDAAWESAAGDTLMGMDVMLWRLTDLKYEAEASPRLPEGAILALTWKLYAKPDEPAAVVDFYEDASLPEGQCWVNVNGTENYYPVNNELFLDLLAKLPAATSTDSTPPVGADDAVDTVEPGPGQDNATHKE